MLEIDAIYRGNVRWVGEGKGEVEMICGVLGVDVCLFVVV